MLEAWSLLYIHCFKVDTRQMCVRQVDGRCACARSVAFLHNRFSFGEAYTYLDSWEYPQAAISTSNELEKESQ